MTEKQLRALVAEKAESHIGLKESDGSYRCIIDTYNSIRPLPRGYLMSLRDPWCAAFVSAVGQECGLGNILFPECACNAMIELYRAAGRYEDASLGVPHVGDIIMYNYNPGAGAEHTGLITAVDGDTLRVVEGNSNDAVSVRTINASTWYIYGFCQPDYASAADESEPPHAGGDGRADAGYEDESAEAPKEELRAELYLPYLRRGDTGECVRAAQAMLIARGFRCGPWGSDGEFGDATYGAVQRFQRAKKLEIDGVVGRESWTALLGL